MSEFIIIFMLCVVGSGDCNISAMKDQTKGYTPYRYAIKADDYCFGIKDVGYHNKIIIDIVESRYCKQDTP